MPGRQPRLMVLAVVAATALIAAGCGGGSKKPSGPTKASYLATADAICKQTHARTSPLISQIKTKVPELFGGGPSAAKAIAGVVARLGTVAGANLARLRALTRPSADRAAIARFMNPLNTVVQSIGRAAAALRSGQALVAASLLAEVEPTASKVAAAARAYGFKQCTQVLSPLG